MVADHFCLVDAYITAKPVLAKQSATSLERTRTNSLSPMARLRKGALSWKRDFFTPRYRGPMTGNPLENLRFFDFPHVTSPLFVELRTVFFGTNFYFLTFVKEGYGTSFFSQGLIAHDARPKRIPRPAGDEHETKSQYDMRKSVHWADHQEFAFRAYRGWMLRSECNGKAHPERTARSKSSVRHLP